MRGLAGLSLALGVVALAACQSDLDARQPTTSISQAGAALTAPDGFSCPTPGTRIAIGDGSPWTYTGTDPRDPFICLATSPQGDARRRLAAWMDLPTTDDEALRAGFHQLWPLVPGKRFNYSWRWRNPNGGTSIIRDEYRVIGPGREMVAGTERDIVVIERTERHLALANFERLWTFWYDPQSRLVVRSQMQAIRGTGDNRFNWQATMISVPGV